jgi:Ca2+-transporting ATPase
MAGISLLYNRDHIDTAMAIARELGILTDAEAITGTQIDAMSDEEFTARFMNISYMPAFTGAQNQNS